MRIIRFAALSLSLASFAGAQFYVKDQQYRFAQSDPRCANDRHCSYEEMRVADHHDFSINFIEVSDRGALWDPAQLAGALNQLEKARFGGKQKPIVFIYIHGWHNNAQERQNDATKNCTDRLFTGDVAKFRGCGLPEIAETYPATLEGAPPRVVGIYLAWHGNDFNWPVLNIVPSYPIRRHYARAVGELGMEDTFQRIVNQIARDGRRDDYFVIAMGHSFGSRVLETAAEVISVKNAKVGFMHQYREQIKNYAQTKSRPEPGAPAVAPATTPAAPKPRPPVDLIFHVNAASSNSVSIATIKDWNRACASRTQPAGCDQSPIYLAVSSRADLLTALVMPIANVVFFAPVTDQYHLISAANTPWLQTHRIPQSVASCPASSSLNSFCFAVHADPGSEEILASYEVRPKSGKVPARFWAMNSDHWIAAPEAILHSIPVFRNLVKQHWLISNHGDVWNPGVFGLVKGVIQQEGTDKGFAASDPETRQRRNRRPMN